MDEWHASDSPDQPPREHMSPEPVEQASLFETSRVEPVAASTSGPESGIDTGHDLVPAVQPYESVSELPSQVQAGGEAVLALPTSDPFASHDDRRAASEEAIRSQWRELGGE